MRELINELTHQRDLLLHFELNTQTLSDVLIQNYARDLLSAVGT
jgi:hypothetical protein